MTVIAIALGGALGACLRAACHGALARHLGAGFPHGVYVVNALGSLLLGLVSGSMPPLGGGEWHTFIATGFCGSFTTFSTFAYGGTALIVERRFAALTAHIAANVLLSFAAAMLGLALASPR